MKINKELIHKTLFIGFYILIFLILDIAYILALKIKSPNIFSMVLLNVALGLLLSSFMFVKQKILKVVFFVFINFVMIFYTALVVDEIVIDKTVGHVFNFYTIVYNFQNIMNEYGSDVLEIVIYRLPLLLFLLTIVILFIYVSKLIFLGTSKNKAPLFSTKAKITTLSISIVCFILSLIFIDPYTFDFLSNMERNGLKVASFCDIMHIDNVIILDEKSGDGSKTYDKSKYNIMNIDFDEIINKESRKEYNEINNFIKNRIPSEKNDYTGLFKNKNLIIICAESWNSNIVSEDLFPATYRLMNNGFRLNNFYQPHSSSSTSTGEFSLLTGMLPMYNDTSFVNSKDNDMGFTVFSKLKEAGYNTHAFLNTLSTFYGRDKSYLRHFDTYMACDTGLYEAAKTKSPSDIDLIKIAYETVKKDKPYLAYVLSYDGHKPYNKTLDGTALEYYKKVDEKYKDRHSYPVKNYIAKNMFLEEGLEFLLSKLEEDGELEDTVICLVPDHYPYGLSHIKDKGATIDALMDFYNSKNVYDDISIVDKTEIIIWSSAIEKMQNKIQIDKVTSSHDITPTLLNLFGLEFDSRLYPGNDIFSEKSGRAIYQNGLYIDENGNKINLLNIIKNEKDSKIIETFNLINYCKFNIRNDYYKYLFN
jgi:hypothetical protein